MVSRATDQAGRANEEALLAPLHATRTAMDRVYPRFRRATPRPAPGLPRPASGLAQASGQSAAYFGGAAGFCVLAGGVRPEYTAFRIGLIVRRYAKMAFRSSSVMF